MNSVIRAVAAAATLTFTASASAQASPYAGEQLRSPLVPTPTATT